MVVQRRIADLELDRRHGKNASMPRAANRSGVDISR